METHRYRSFCLDVIVLINRMIIKYSAVWYQQIGIYQLNVQFFEYTSTADLRCCLFHGIFVITQPFKYKIIVDMDYNFW